MFSKKEASNTDMESGAGLGSWRDSASRLMEDMRRSNAFWEHGRVGEAGADRVLTRVP